VKGQTSFPGFTTFNCLTFTNAVCQKNLMMGHLVDALFTYEPVLEEEAFY